MGRGGGFSAVNPLTRMLADKQAAAAARARLVDRVKRDSMSVTGEPLHGPRLRSSIPPRNPDLEPAGDAAAAEVSRQPLDDSIRQPSASPALDGGCADRGRIGEVDAIAAPAATLLEDRLSRQAPGSRLLVETIRASDLFPPSEMSVLAQCLAGRTSEEYLADRDATERRLRNIPPFLVPESSLDRVLQVLNRDLDSTGDKGASEPAPPRLDEAGHALVAHHSENQTSGHRLPRPLREPPVDEPDRSSTEAHSVPDFKGAPVAAVQTKGADGNPVEARDVASAMSARLNFRRAAPEPFDFERVEKAIATLSKVGFERARAYRDLADAYAVAARLGHDGPREAVLDFLRREIEARTESPSSAPHSVVANEAPATARDLSEVREEHAGERDHGPASDVQIEAPAPIRPTVAHLLEWTTISNKLFNASRDDELFSWTISEALERQDEFLAKFRQLWSVGRKTVAELAAVLDDYRAGRIVSPVPIAVEPSSPEAEDALDDDVSSPALDELVVDILRRCELSVRAQRLLGEPSCQSLRLRDFLDDRTGFSAAVLATGNVGRRTLNEITDLLTPQAEAAERGRMAEPAGVDIVGPRDERPPRDRMRALIAALDPKQTDVLTRRYGLDGSAPLTLQEIGETVHVTRERVRQVEQKALRRLQKGPSAPTVAAFMSAEQDAQWEVIASGKPWVKEDELSERGKVLAPLFRIAVDVQFGGLRGWLDNIAAKTADGWSRRNRASAEHSATIELLDEAARSRPCPLPVSSLRSAEGDPIQTLYGDFSGSGWSIFEGYLCAGYAGVRVKRRLRLHALAVEISLSGLFDIGTLIRAYRARYPDDEVLSRVILKEMDEAPHLFQCVFDYVWLELPEGGTRRLASVPFETATIGGETFEEGGGGYRIAQMLEAGPLSRAEIAERLTEDGTISRTSVVPMLVSNPCFRRIAPGVFGKYGMDSRQRAEARRELLNEADCRLWCFAMRSGAATNFFPAWDADYEMELAEWAHRHSPPEVFRSLFEVIDPREWPVPQEIAAAVESVRTREAEWVLGFERVDVLGRRFVDPQQFLSILAYLSSFGSIGWIAANRICGARLNRADASDVLAFLMLAGLVEPQDDWQAPHYATRKASDLFASAAERQFARGKLSWDDPEFAFLMAEVERGPRAVGWVFEDEAAAAIQAWRTGKLPTERAFEGAEGGGEEPIGVEDTITSEDYLGIFD